jgi:hypothetical protein
MLPLLKCCPLPCQSELKSRKQKSSNALTVTGHFVIIATFTFQAQLGLKYALMAAEVIG